VRFVQRLTALRAKYPILRRNLFLTGLYDAELEVKDLTWINASGSEMRAEEWADERMLCFGMLIDGRAAPTGVRQRGAEATMLIVLNAHHDLVDFTLPSAAGGSTWRRLIDTNVPDSEEEERAFEFGSHYGTTGRSLVLLALRE
jgi:glycogen operon protein